MLDDTGIVRQRLIHMNGRIYDARLCRFLSADPMIQNPYDLQSYNRYSYCLNNPLRYTDLSGYYSVLGLEFRDGGGVFGFVQDVGTYVSNAAEGANEGLHSAVNTSGEFAAGAVVGVAESNDLRIVDSSTDETTTLGSTAADVGRIAGNLVGEVQGYSEMVAGDGLVGGGVVASGTGVGAVAGVPAAVASAVLETHGALVTASSTNHLLKNLDNFSVKSDGADGKVNSKQSPTAELKANTEGNAARKDVMGQEWIPTSQQPVSQSKNASGHKYTYEVTKEGGGTQLKSVQQQTMDTSHPREAHWEAGTVKTDPVTGKVRTNNYNRPKLNNGKSKEDYDE